MKNFKLIILMVMTIVVAAPHAIAKEVHQKVLMVLSSYGQTSEQGKEQPGYEFDEFSKAYMIFKDNGLLVDIASPQGGQVKADKYDPNKPYNAKVLSDNTIMAKLTNTLPTKAINANNYDAVFVVGGKGAMFDLPKDTALQNIIADIYQQKGTVAAVCHGPAALVDVKLSNGSFLIAGKAINSFTNEEEKLFGKKWLKDFDFMLEDKLVERGAKFQSSEIMLSHVAIDGRLITGQNPSSTVDVATELVKSIGLTPVVHELETEDKTLAVVAKFISGEQSALNSLTQNKAQYNVPLVGMYGFYFLKIAETTRDFEQSLALMLVAQKELNNPSLDIKIASTQSKLGLSDDAKATLAQLILNHPDFKPAQDMLKTL